MERVKPVDKLVKLKKWICKNSQMLKYQVVMSNKKVKTTGSSVFVNSTSLLNQIEKLESENGKK